MNEILGLVDSLEASILEGKKVPFTEKIILDEKGMLKLVDKIRLALKSNGRIIRQTIDLTKEPEKETEEINAEQPAMARDTFEESASFSENMRMEANEYADNVLANLQLLVTKLQKELVRVEKSIEVGRSILEEVKSENKAQDRQEG